MLYKMGGPNPYYIYLSREVQFNRLYTVFLLLFDSVYDHTTAAFRTYISCGFIGFIRYLCSHSEANHVGEILQRSVFLLPR